MINLFNVFVVISAFNSEKAIGRAILLILKQTTPVSEILLLDEASKGNKIAVDLNMHFDLTIIKFEKNQGAQVARVAGIKVANDEWIAFLESYDFCGKRIVGDSERNLMSNYSKMCKEFLKIIKNIKTFNIIKKFYYYNLVRRTLKERYSYDRVCIL